MFDITIRTQPLTLLGVKANKTHPLRRRDGRATDEAQEGGRPTLIDMGAGRGENRIETSPPQDGEPGPAVGGDVVADLAVDVFRADTQPDPDAAAALEGVGDRAPFCRRDQDAG